MVETFEHIGTQVLFFHLWRHLFGVKLKRLITQFVSHLFPISYSPKQMPTTCENMILPTSSSQQRRNLPEHKQFTCGILLFFFWGGGDQVQDTGVRADGRWLYHPGTAHHLRDGGGVFRIVFFSEVQGIIYIEFLHCSFIT